MLIDAQSSFLIKKNVLHLKANICITDECYEDTIVFVEMLNIFYKITKGVEQNQNEGPKMNVLHNANANRHDVDDKR